MNVVEEPLAPYLPPRPPPRPSPQFWGEEPPTPTLPPKLGGGREGGGKKGREKGRGAKRGCVVLVNKAQKNLRVFSSLAVLVAWTCLIRPARAESHGVVAVFPAEVRGVKFSPAFADNVTDYLEVLLTQRGFQVVPRSNIKDKLRQQQRESYRACFEQSCQIELGREVAADKSLSSQILKIGNSCRITLRLYDLKKATTEMAGSAACECSEDGVTRGMESALANMFYSIGSDTLPKAPTGLAPKQPGTTPPAEARAPTQPTSGAATAPARPRVPDCLRRENLYAGDSPEKRAEVRSQLKKLADLEPNEMERAQLLLRLGLSYDDEANAIRIQPGSQVGSASKANESPDETVRAQQAKWRTEAVSIYSTIIQNHPTFARLDEVLYQLALDLWELGQKPKALDTYKTLIKYHPNSKRVFDAYMSVGEHYFGQADWAKALFAYQKAAQSPDAKVQACANYKQAYCHYLVGEYSKAKEEFTAVIKSDGSSADMKSDAKDRLRSMGYEPPKDAAEAVLDW